MSKRHRGARGARDSPLLQVLVAADAAERVRWLGGRLAAAAIQAETAAQRFDV